MTDNLTTCTYCSGRKIGELENAHTLTDEWKKHQYHNQALNTK